MYVISNLFQTHHQTQTSVQSVKKFIGKTNKSRKYKEGNKMSYLERFSSLLALMQSMLRDMLRLKGRAGIQKTARLTHSKNEPLSVGLGSK